jgi:hypothetical protein
VQSTLILILPRPTTRAALARSRTVMAADGSVALRFERMTGQLVLFQVEEELSFGDINQRMKMNQTFDFFEDPHGRPVHRLVTVHARHPDGVYFFDRFQWHHLIIMTAAAGLVFPHLRVDSLLVTAGLGVNFNDFQAGDFAKCVLVGDGFWEVVAGIEHVDLLGRIATTYQGQHHHGFGTKAAGKEDLVDGKVLIQSFDPFLEAQGLEFNIQGFNVNVYNGLCHI